MRVQHPQSESNVAAMFDRIAPRYDFLNALLSARQDHRWRKRLMSMVPYRPGGRYLDVATGTGDVLVAAMKTHPEYADFVGVDISPNMLKFAKEKAAQQHPAKNAVFEVMSAEKLNLTAESCDTISIAFGLRNVVNRKAALEEFYRVLKPGGTLLILEFFPPNKGLFSRLFQFYFHKVLPTIGGLFSDKEAYQYLPQSVGSFYLAEELRSTLYDVGFTVDTMVNFIFGSCRLVKASKP